MNKSGVSDQVISLPSGGGTIKGLGETFSPDLHTGTGNLSVPIALPAGRNGFQPDLKLVYSTGSGNGPFGLGWSLNVPGVSRDTSKKLPVYDDVQDSFLISGAEQLVPIASPSNGNTIYRPRTEGIFSRITHMKTAHTDYWQVRSRDGLVSLYGDTNPINASSPVVFDPDGTQRIFSWHLSQTRDPFGNLIEYVYEREPSRQDGPHKWDQLYLRTIRYGDYGTTGDTQFVVSVDFTYEKRFDAFSNYKSGFEIRTTQRCTQILISTNSDAVRPTKMYKFIYVDERNTALAPANAVSILCSVQVRGVDGTTVENLPALDFGYTGFDPSRRSYQAIKGIGNAMPERSLSHPDYELADLFGRGLPDVVQIGDTVCYWRNLGGGTFDVPRPIEQLPSGIRLGNPGVELADADGDGHIDLLLSAGRWSGYVPLTVSGKEATGQFIQYTDAPPFALNDPQVRLMDLDGDGTTDVLRTGLRFELYFNDHPLGWSRTETRTRGDLAEFPNIEFSDPRVKLADMTGDGLQDIVFVSPGSVAYWPYIGNGRWGSRVTMAGNIRFPDRGSIGGIAFDPSRLLLGDIDGDGVSDMVYVESGRTTLWINQSGNGWSDPVVVQGTPPIADADAVRLADMLGSGTQGILWTCDLRTFGDSSYKFLDLTGGVKPYLLNQRNNNAGASTIVEYAPSTRFYLQDDILPHTRWNTRLPFPVQVVTRVEVIDAISGGKLSSEYAYHQGYWDGDEREFRGFGMVEQFDSESFDTYQAPGSSAKNQVDAAQYSPPTLTRSWFHQGQVQNSIGVWSEPDYATSTWPDDPQMMGPEQRVELTAIAKQSAQNSNLTLLRHALRALRGSVLRTELYALDGSNIADRPYTVTEAQFDVREINPPTQGSDRLHVFFPFQIGTRTSQWERGTEPMTQFAFTENYDTYGLPGSTQQIAVPRGRNPLVQLTSPGAPYLATCSTTEYARTDIAEQYIVDRVCRTSQFEIVNDGMGTVFGLRELAVSQATSLRFIGHVRTYYDGEAFAGLPLAVLGAFGAPVRSESLVFQDDFLTKTFGPADPLAVSVQPAYLNPQGVPAWPTEYPAEFTGMLPQLAGYVYYADTDATGSPGGYYAVSSRRSYDFHNTALTPRGLLVVNRDPLDGDTTVAYDTYDLLPVSVTDPAGLTMLATYDYRVLQARQITDINGNIAGFAFSPCGLVTAQTVQGKNGEGDSAHPSVTMTYDLLAFSERGRPMSVQTTRRAHHDSETDVAAADRDEVLVSVQYSDGFGRLLQTRGQAEDTLFADSFFGGNVIPADQSVAVGATAGRTRAATDPDNVIVSGWQVYDNKGQVVEKYEPFFDKDYYFVTPAANQLGQKVTIFYDPRGQAVRTVNSDGSEQRVLLGVPVDITNPGNYTPTPWESYVYDPNDNAGRTAGVAASSYSSHWNTPSSMVLDALGRTVSATARNGPDATKDWFSTQSSYDIQGNLIGVTDALGRAAFRYVFDIVKRRWRMDSIDAGRHDTVPDVLGNPVEARDSKGALSLQAWDVLRRPIRLWARDDKSSPVTLRQRMEYGDGGALDQPAADRATARAQNLLGQLTRHHDEAGLTILTAVDFKKNVLDKSRNVISDAPMLKIFDQSAAQGWNISAFQVDWTPALPQTLSGLEGELLETIAYQTTVAYDALNRIKSMQFPLDVEGKRRELLPQYNRGGGLDQVSLDGAVYLERVTYDAKGQRALVAYGNGVMTRYAYDPQTFRLTRLRSEHFAKPDNITYQPSGDALQDFGYDYDLVGNILGIRDRTPGSGILNNSQAGTVTDPTLAQLLVKGDALDRSFLYDPIYRLLSATGRECDAPPDGPPWEDQPRCTDLTKTRAYTEAYTYDSLGSMLQLAHRNGSAGFTRDFTVDPANNRLVSLKVNDIVYGYSFDANGNMLSETTSRHFDWNYADQMKVFRTQTDGVEPSVFAQYLYDFSGQRVKKLVRKQSGQVETTHYIDGSFEHYRWGTGTQAAENNHVHVRDDKQRIALVRIGPAQSSESSPNVQYHMADHLGSSNVLVDDKGRLVNREEFTPYGDTSFGSFAKKRYRFTSRERDDESSLTYHGARYFCSWLARWTTCDPLGQRAGDNLYCYSDCSPLNSVDLHGLQPEPPPTANNLGNIAPMNKQSAAGRDTSGARTTENEHVIASGKLKAVTHDPNTGTSDYGSSQYRKDTTVQIERVTALNKTHLSRGGAGTDNAVTSTLKAKAQTSTPIDFNQEVVMSSLDNAWRAGRETHSSVVPSKLTEGALGQISNLFARQSLADSGQIIRSRGYSFADHPNTFDFNTVGNAAANQSAAPAHSPPSSFPEGYPEFFGPIPSGGGGIEVLDPAPAPTVGNGIAAVLMAVGPELAQRGARALGASPRQIQAVGFLASVGVGAGAGALAGLPEGGVGAIPGAIIGGGIGAVGYLAKTYELCVPFYSCD